jgi:hypothetical protein
MHRSIAALGGAFLAAVATVGLAAPASAAGPSTADEQRASVVVPASALSCRIAVSSTAVGASCKGNPLQPYWVTAHCVFPGADVRGATEFPTVFFGYGPTSTATCPSGGRLSSWDLFAG